jgi:hypothetical protein
MYILFLHYYVFRYRSTITLTHLDVTKCIMINGNALQTVKSYLKGTIFHFDDMSYWIVHILRFPLICDLPACHIGAIKMKKSSLRHSTIIQRKQAELFFKQDGDG